MARILWGWPPILAQPQKNKKFPPLSDIRGGAEAKKKIFLKSDRTLLIMTDSKDKKIPLGAHLSISKGLQNALYEADRLECSALQIFTKNSTTWKEKALSFEQIELFKKAKKETGISVVAAHTSYLINLAAIDEKKHALSCGALANELKRCALLDIPYAVLHPGSHMGSGEDKGIEKIALSIKKIFSKTPGIPVRLLLETTAGQGSGIGYKFEQIASIIEKSGQMASLGVCLDTCHIFAAGYDIRNEGAFNDSMEKFDSIIGIKNLFLIHINDSKKDFGSRVDRHEHIGRGAIGIKAFEFFMNDDRLKDVGKIIETPGGDTGENMDAVNLKILKGLAKR